MAFSSSTVTIGANTKKSDYDRVLDNTIYLKSGATIYTGEKTYQSGTVHVIKPKVDGIQTRSGTGSVSIECGYLSSAGNSVANLKTKVIELGDWNMDTGSTLAVAHGLSDYTKIRQVDVIIRADSGVDRMAALNTISSGGDSQGGTSDINVTTITLIRVAGGTFDSIGYNDTSYNRGFLTITYED